MFPLYAVVIVAYHCAVLGRAAPATYDQRQTGDLNVQVHIKDLQVVALLDSELLEDYTDYDYFYDYADFTVKPSHSTTSARPWPTPSTTEKPETVSSDTTTSKPTAELPATIENVNRENSTASINSEKVQTIPLQNATTSKPIPQSPPEIENVNTRNASASSSTEKIQTAPSESRETTKPSSEVPATPATIENAKDESTSVSLSVVDDTETSSLDNDEIEDSENARNGTTKVRINDKTGSLFDEKDIVESRRGAIATTESATGSKPVQERRSMKRCRSGYSPDGKGRCRRVNRRKVLIPIF